MRRRLDGALLSVLLVTPLATARAQHDDCTVFCSPTLKVEPTFTTSNLFGGAEVAQLDGEDVVSVVREPRETVVEMILAVDIPTEIPRVAATVETIWQPFERTDNPVELELELKLYILEPEQTGGWVGMHFDVVNQLSPAARPNDESAYTNKLDFELDTAFLIFHRLPETNWLRNVELELSLDYLATGIPKAGDRFPDGTLFLEDASPWSLSFVIVLPIAPLFP